MEKAKEVWKRIGKCNGCALCCLLSHKARKINNEDQDWLDELRQGWKVIRSTKKHIYLAKWDPCPYLTFDLKCSIHKKIEQPGICKKFPIDPHGFYQVVKKRCSIKFKRKK